MLSPLSWLLLALLLAWLGSRLRERGRWLVRTAMGVAAIAILAMTPLVANTLVGWLEMPATTSAACDASTPPVAVVLAGGIDARPGGPADLSALAISSRRRVERAAAWWHERPGRALILSGGPYQPGSAATGEVMADYARRLGVDAKALRVEGVSTSTWENARGLMALSPPLPRRVVLVTSAMHMPRARYAMASAGFEVCAIATDSRRIPFGLPGYLIPGSSALVKTEAALHELVGMAYYRWRAARARMARKRTAAGGPSASHNDPGARRPRAPAG